MNKWGTKRKTMQINITNKWANISNPVRDALTNAGYSSVKVLQAVNSRLGEYKITKENTPALGDVKLKGKKEPRAIVNMRLGTLTLASGDKTEKRTVTIADVFMAWHDAVVNAFTIVEFDIVLPSYFRTWLEKFAKVTEEKKEEATK